MLWHARKVLAGHFPDLSMPLPAPADSRSRREYTLGELVMGGITLFPFKCTSRNEYNHKFRDDRFSGNCYRMFGLPLPGMDAVNELLEGLEEQALERLLGALVASLLEKRVFHKFRFWEGCFHVAVDATGAYNRGETPPDEIRGHALKKVSYAGKESYYSNVLEARLILHNGISIPVACEWVSNDPGQYHRQDCEQNAFKRLSVKLKKYFPRLPPCILAGGLYATGPFMEICKANGWSFIAVFKDGNLPGVWQEAESLLKINTAGHHKQHLRGKSCDITREYRWINNIEYLKYSIHRAECRQRSVNMHSKEQAESRFVFITSVKISRDMVADIVLSARGRRYIEDAFNTMKNRGYVMHHKFNRNNFTAIRNRHCPRLIAHMICQLTERCIQVRDLLRQQGKMTVTELWKNLTEYMTMCRIRVVMDGIDLYMKQPGQVRPE